MTYVAPLRRQKRFEMPTRMTFGFSPLGGLVHRYAGHRRFDTIYGPATGFEHRWKCGGRVINGKVKLVLTPPEDAPLCPQCPAPTDPECGLVYFMRVGDELKVGHTSQLAVRLKQLGGELICSVPGSRRLERVVLDACPTPVRGREWFAQEDEAAILAVFEDYEPAVAA